MWPECPLVIPLFIIPFCYNICLFLGNGLEARAGSRRHCFRLALYLAVRHSCHLPVGKDDPGVGGDRVSVQRRADAKKTLMYHGLDRG